MAFAADYLVLAMKRLLPACIVIVHRVAFGTRHRVRGVIIRDKSDYKEDDKTKDPPPQMPFLLRLLLFCFLGLLLFLRLFRLFFLRHLHPSK